MIMLTLSLPSHQPTAPLASSGHAKAPHLAHAVAATTGLTSGCKAYLPHSYGSDTLGAQLDVDTFVNAFQFLVATEVPHPDLTSGLLPAQPLPMGLVLASYCRHPADDADGEVG